MIELGCFDGNVPDSACDAYKKEVEQLTRVALANVVAGNDKLVTKRLAPGAPDAMSIAQVQQALKDIGFFPGGKDDGICGYRTLSAIRLFQEYVRSVEKQDCVPDGRFGPQSQAHLQRWLDRRLQSTWAPAIAAWEAGTPLPGEYGDWLAFLDQVKQQYLARPTPVLQMVNDFKRPCDTRKVAEWDFSPRAGAHLVGIRRREMSGRFDDIFVLLLKGLVFKFQGTTEPGASDHPAGPPYLVPGQHAYHFGWHKSSYLALRPQGAGVLVVRAGTDKTLTDADLSTGLEPNATINIHWGGRGMRGAINNWSEGCQTINGTVYINPSDEIVSCASFAATTPNEASTDRLKTRGAYNVLVDLITALGSDLPGASVKYSLLDEADLALAPALQQRLARSREAVIKMSGDG
jgi:hypothetical protein